MKLLELSEEGTEHFSKFRCRPLPVSLCPEFGRSLGAICSLHTAHRSGDSESLKNAVCNPFLPAPGLLQSGSRKSLDFPCVWEEEVEQKIDTRSWPQKDPEEIRKSDWSFELLIF